MNVSISSAFGVSKSARVQQNRSIDPDVVVRDARRCLADPQLRDKNFFIELLDVLDCESSGISLKLRRDVAILKGKLAEATPTLAAHDNTCRALEF